MKIKQTILVAVFTLLVGVGILTPVTTYATQKCGDVDTAIIGGDMCKNVSTDKTKSGDIRNSGLWAILVIAIQIMTAGVGVLAVGGIVYGSVLYVSAADSAEQVKKARTIITNVVIGIVAYGLMYALLNYLIPGGLFG